MKNNQSRSDFRDKEGEGILCGVYVKFCIIGFVGEFDRHLECSTHFSEHVMDACNLCYKQIQLQWQVGRCERDGSRDVEQQSHDESSSDSEWGIVGTQETKPKAT